MVYTNGGIYLLCHTSCDITFKYHMVYTKCVIYHICDILTWYIVYTNGGIYLWYDIPCDIDGYLSSEFVAIYLVLYHAILV